ncbi:uncharacterized protein ATC70_000565 [Mucor velutinosus]|uniref:Uncharacterized protein n=1 Tax=Mucor velutinosus TaxID=708070 RepID=A0AAN7DHQ1_9FUNG|nr:hypothetical protein ATC70_000565 [Mucor velutinosus]
MWKLYYQVNKSGLTDKFKTERKKTKKEENMSLWQIIARFMAEIDIVGSILLVAGLYLILLPLVLALPSWGGWTSPTTLATLCSVSRKFSAATAFMIGRGYNIAYIVCEALVGYVMKRFRVWRPFVSSGVALTMLDVGLMIPARQPSSSTAFLVISQTIAGMGFGFLYTRLCW